jgi:hypothetical protein
MSWSESGCACLERAARILAEGEALEAEAAAATCQLIRRYMRHMAPEAFTGQQFTVPSLYGDGQQSKCASSLMILCMRLFSGSIARRASRVRRAIGFRGSTMSHSFKKNVQTTRRILLQTAIGAVSAVSFLGLTTRDARAAKSSKSDVVYQDSPKGTQQCDGCRQFIPPNACKQVEGVISPSGWCKMWAKKAS